MKFKKIALVIAALTLSSMAFSHGYIESPESRAYKCKKQSSCGAIQYEPQSIEQISGFPNGLYPADGKLASGGNRADFATLDIQTSTAWDKNAINAGENTFIWHNTASHSTKNWRYYISKQDWDTNQVLSRASFELTPFCIINANSSVPAKKVSHVCNVPERTGYQVIYGVWEINDTNYSFYQIIDVEFNNKPLSN